MYIVVVVSTFLNISGLWGVADEKQAANRSGAALTSERYKEYSRKMGELQGGSGEPGAVHFLQGELSQDTRKGYLSTSLQGVETFPCGVDHGLDSRLSY